MTTGPDDYRKLSDRATELLIRRRAHQLTHAQVMADLWAYAAALEVEALLKRLGVTWRRK